MPSEPDSKFDALRSDVRWREGCPRCGRPGVSDGNVRIQVTEWGLDGEGRRVRERSLKNPKSVQTRSVSFCEACCVEVYLALDGMLMKEGKQ